MNPRTEQMMDRLAKAARRWSHDDLVDVGDVSIPRWLLHQLVPDIDRFEKWRVDALNLSIDMDDCGGVPGYVLEWSEAKREAVGATLDDIATITRKLADLCKQELDARGTES
ncbi:MAG TPA: hypothetical protein VFL78_11685 [Rhodanobacteraceae bacterium]|nr:hypothetical protein [Rhodanobacteraceae bacterium]